ncbi:ParB/RepB/Spo0J family partition protein [uncultured Tateyamaria sp.]|uniref:ParB/RepB/Spo0J family partition protein n=1 Tax=uncultured Tateyamaria sp. TaxID=455651 RepID=UPI002615CA5D|nr:ParB/RepB/Spo0J family partition protein [uncultured Tateyamaria sp.]
MTNQTQITTGTAIIYASLDQLYLHDLNPRQEVAQEAIETLAESIKTCGLLQNLGGLQDDSGKVGIVAGGRRLRALAFLAETDPAQESVTSIPVLLAKDAEQAELWANAENTARADLDPADEIRAYGRMAKSNASADDIASAFGVTVAHVKGRLKLSDLPEAALDALKAKSINLTVAQKLTTADDEKLIFEVLRLIDEGQITNTGQIDGVLHPKAVKSTDRRATFVGVEAYEAAGGKVSRDLFSEDVFFENRDILDEVFALRLREAADKVMKEAGWAWVMPHDESYLGWHVMDEHKFERVYPVEGVLSDDLTERYDELAELAEGDVLNEAGQAELDSLQAVLDGAFTEAQRAIAGCVVHVGNNGQLEVTGGLIKAADKKAAIEAGILAKSHHGGSGEKTPKNPYSQKLQADLEAIKLASLQNAMLDQPDLLLDLLTFQLSGMTGFRDVLDISLGTPCNAPSTETGFDVDKRLSKPSSCPEDRWGVDLIKAFAAFKKKGKKHRDAELARQLAKLLTGGDEVFAAVLADKCNAGIRKVWTPTTENLFKRISGVMMDGIYCDLLDLAPTDERAKAFSKKKKADKAEALENLFSDPTTQKLLGVTEAQKARIDAWLPDYFA